MRRSWNTVALAWLCLTALPLLAGCDSSSVFYGSRVINEAGFVMDYTVLNHEETAELTLVAGESLRVEFAHDRGSVDVTVGLPDREPIYRGTGQTEAEFTLTIPESGDYRISVTGHRASGKAAFLREGR